MTLGPLPLAQHFLINVDRVAHETIDGETIMIQLETGIYYSLAGSGAEIWAMLAAGSSTDQIVERLEQRYEESREELTRATTELVRELRREELLEDNPDAAEREVPTKGAVTNDSNGAPAPFDRPTLKKYTDMQYFLMLDPIHEVNGTGWPNPPTEQTVR
jgi:Coenzyme PQQ synthesis protein D (PqqD)